MDLEVKYADYYAATTQPEIITIGPKVYISLLGNGSPGTDIFYKKKKAIIDFARQVQIQFEGTEKAFNSDIIEIFYWFEEEEGFVDIGNFYTTVDLDLLHYRIAVLMPDYITKANVQTAVKNSAEIEYGNQFELFHLPAGKYVQIMHIGPFADELQTLPRLQHFATTNNLVKSGMHQEIHITPFEKGQNQENLRTILRDPVEPIIKNNIYNGV